MRLALSVLAALVLVPLAHARGEFKREVPATWVPDALCVHKYEGAWNANTGNGYHGGLQMDWSFMRNYGPWTLRHLGGAENWPIRTQLLIAYRGWRHQGWGAWPNSARMCGLL